MLSLFFNLNLKAFNKAEQNRYCFYYFFNTINNPLLLLAIIMLMRGNLIFKYLKTVILI